MPSLLSLNPFIPYWMQLVYAFLIGISFGSFASVFLARFPHGKSLGGRSMCTQCKHTIAWYDLIPLISYLILRGRCRYCKTEISPLYIYLELTFGFALALFVIALRVPPITIVLPTLAAVLIIMLIAWYDTLTQEIPDVLTFILLLCAIALRIAMETSGHPAVLSESFFGALIPFTFFGMLWLVSWGRWIGSGDILFGAVLGMLLGYPTVVIMLGLAYTIGAAVAIMLLATGLATRQSRIAFGPFLAIATMICLLLQHSMMARGVLWFL